MAEMKQPVPNCMRAAVVKRAACRLFGVNHDELVSPQRYAHLMRVRRAVSVVLDDMGYSRAAIARHVGRTNHSTIASILPQARVDYANDAEFRDRVDQMRAEIT